MKIGINALYLIPQEVGGTETYLMEILQRIPLDFPEFKIVVFTNRENDALFRNKFSRHKNFQICQLHFHASNRFARILREQFELPFKVQSSKIDLLWNPGITLPLFCFLPQVTTICDMVHLRHPDDLPVQTNGILNLLLFFITRKAQRILTISEFSKKEIDYFFHVPAKKIHVTYLAASLEFKPPIARPDEARLSQLGAGKTPYLLCVSNSFPHKNLPCLIQAFKALLNEIPHQLILVGQPRLNGKGALQEAIKGLPDPNRVTCLTYALREDLIFLYQHASLFILPTRYEGFGLPVLEAMVAGTPVLTTRCGALPEVASDCAFFFDEHNAGDLANKIRDVFHLSEDKRKAHIEKAKKWAAAFSWEKTAAETVRCFRSLLNPTIPAEY